MIRGPSQHYGPFSPEIHAQLQDLAARAERNPIDADTMRAATAGTLHLGDARPDQVIEITGGWRVYYTVEDHPQTDGTVRRLRHVSISHAEMRTPPIMSVDLICHMLGFQLPVAILKLNNSVYYERIDQSASDKEAINLLEPLDLSDPTRST